LRQQGLALGLRQRLGVALGHEDARGDLLGAPVPVAKRLGVAFGEARDIGDRLFAVAAEHQRRAVAMCLAELVARRDVGDAVFEPEVPEPRRFGDVEMIDGMQVMIEAGRRGLLGHQAAAILQAAVDEQNAQTCFGEIAAEYQAVMTGTDDDAVVGFL
jgi:hypothetical protein